jgi:uncharacterized membrane-anchored protein
MNYFTRGLAAATALSASFLAFAESEPTTEPTAEQVEEISYEEYAQGIWDALEKKQGTILLPAGVATLNVPENYIYLPPEDAARVLVDIWGNPPRQSLSQGMLMPANTTPMQLDSWAVEVDYEEEGHVKDDDAEDINYADLLKEMQADTKAASEHRVENGYDPISLVGWASPPFYDNVEKKLHWAKEIKFGDSPDHTLNYNIRVLGRQGVLVFNFIADMQQKAAIDAEVETVMAIASFNEGQRYADYQPGVDRVAAYGIGGLIAGKVLAKTGFLALALVFLKKFGVFILLGLGALAKALWSRRK